MWAVWNLERKKVIIMKRKDIYRRWTNEGKIS